MVKPFLLFFISSFIALNAYNADKNRALQKIKNIFSCKSLYKNNTKNYKYFLEPEIIDCSDNNKNARLADHLKKPSLWIHTDDVNGVFAACRLIPAIKKKYPETPILLTTPSFEGKKIADVFCVGTKIIKLLVEDSFQSISTYCQRMNVAAIIMLDRGIAENMLLFSLLKKIPLYLFDINYGHMIQRKFEEDSFFFVDLFNTAPYKIYVKEETDKKFFKKIGILKPEILHGDLDAFGVIERKEMYCQQCSVSEKILKKMFPHPLIFLNIIEPGDIDVYLRVYSQLRELFPDLKIIFARSRADLWMELLKQKIDATEWRYRSVDDEYRDFVKLDGKMFIRIKDLYDSSDILLTTDPKMFFPLHAISSIYLVEGIFSNVKTMNFMEAAAWKSAIMIGRFDDEDDYNDFDQQIKNRNDIDQVILKEISMTHFGGEADAVDKIALLLENQQLYDSLVLHSYYGLKRVSLTTTKEINVFLDDLKKVL